MRTTRHWLSNPTKEIWLILAPAILPVVVVFLFRDYFESQQEVTSMWWLVLVLMVDVGHVYSTLFRFYWERPTFEKHKLLLLIIPIVCFTVGVAIHAYDSFLFWRLLAYMALYHFVRQQYGFVRLYSRFEKRNQISRWIDGAAVYSATLYPVVYWHMFLTDSLSWFVPNDFLRMGTSGALVFEVLYFLIMACYIGKEIYYSIYEQSFNIPKAGLMVGTYLSWYAGIIVFHGDLAFTLLNVVTHGIPYMGLIWLYGERKATRPYVFNVRGVLIFAAVLLTLAYVEESFWDVLVWKDHPDLFPFFTDWEPLTGRAWLSLVVPLLVLPQVTHYVLDGFIWRFSRDATSTISSEN